jgi:L-arabinose isomerase
MPIAQREFTIGLMITALLEDKFNKTGHLREECRRVAGIYEEKLKPLGRIVSTGFFEYEPEAYKAASLLKREGVDVVVLIELAYQKGLIPMRALLELDVPVIVWNTQLVSEFGEDAVFDLIMVNSGMAGLSEVTSALVRSKKKFFVVSGHIEDKNAFGELSEYIAAARALARLRNSKIGVIGHPFEGMTDLMQDDYALMDVFGTTVWPVDHDEVTDAFSTAKDGEAKKLIEREKAKGRTIKVDDAMMLRSARLALALERVVKQNALDAVAEFDQVWLPESRIGIIPFFGTSLMVENHVPFTCEADILRGMAMLVLEEIAGHSTFLEHYILDYKRNLMFDSHDGHGNPALADTEHGVQIVPTIYYKGVNGFGASFNYSYRPGVFTLFSMGNIGDGRFRFIVSEGRNVEMKPRDISAPQTFFQWGGGRSGVSGVVGAPGGIDVAGGTDVWGQSVPGDIREFATKWLRAATSHHHVGAYGRLGGVLRKTAEMAGIEWVSV